MIATYEMQNVMWAIAIWANEPWPPNSCAEEQQQADAHDDLGGDHRQQEQRLGRRRGRGTGAGPGPRPSSVPRTVDDDHGDERDLERHADSASSSSSLANSVGYQSRVKPRQTKFALASR